MEPLLTSILVLAGFVGGFIGSEVGAGGLMTLPVLLFLGLSPAHAVASNALSGWLINVMAAYEYRKSGKVHTSVVTHLAPIALCGAITGAWLMSRIDQELASLIVATLFIAVFFALFVALRGGIAGMRSSSMRFTIAKKISVAIITFFLGVYGGFFAVGVTTLFVATFVFLLRRDFVQAAADAVTISAVFLLGSFVEYAASGFVLYEYAIPLALGSVFGAYCGSRAAIKFGNHWLRGLLFFVVILVISRLGYSVFAATQTP